MIVPTKVLFEHAYGNYAIGAYNINNAEQTMGLFRGAIDSQAPFIIQISKGARSYTDKRMLEAIIRSAEEIFPDAVFAVHLDHGDEATAHECIDSGFYSSVMIDASHDPFDENIAITRRVVDHAHPKGISVEAELGMLGGVEEDIKVDEKNAMLTDPDEAKEFIERRRCGLSGLRHRHVAWGLQVRGRPGPALRPHRGDPEGDPRRPARDARLVVGAAGRGAAHQRGRRHS